MAKNSVREVIKYLEQSLEENGVIPLKIILFGSHSRGEAAEHSDIDVVVLSEAFRGKGIFERAELTKRAEIQTIRQFLVPLDVVALTPEEFETSSSFIAEYAKNGEVM